MAARIKTSTGLASGDVDNRRFPKSDGFYQSPGCDSAPYRLELYIEGGAASIVVSGIYIRAPQGHASQVT